MGVIMKMEWKYNGIAPKRDILGWCAENLPFEYWDYEWEYIIFNQEEAYVLFLLRWA